MIGTGYIVQYSATNCRGTIHLGGTGHSALLEFDLSDCNKTVHDELQRGELPGRSAVKVKFDVAIKNGGLWATKVFLASHKGAASSKKTSRKPKKARDKRRR